MGETVLKYNYHLRGLKIRCRPCIGVQTFQLSPRLFRQSVCVCGGGANQTIRGKVGHPRSSLTSLQLAGTVMAAWRPYSQIVVPDVCFMHSVGNGEPHYGHLHGRSPFPSIAASETRLGSNSERLFVGFHDFGDSTFFPPAPSVFIDTSATGPVEYVEKSGEPLFWIFVTWKI